jgi:hypothetical protein
MILDLPDLQRLSGYTRPHDVKKWLRNNGVSFMVQPSRHPVTTDFSSLRFSPDWSPPPRAKQMTGARS